MARKLSATDIQQLVDRYVAGERMTPLMREAGVSITFLYPHLKRLGIPAKNDRTWHYPRPAIPGLVERYQAGASVLSLAQAFGVSRSVIVQRLRTVGIVARGQSDAERLKWSRMSADARTHQVRAAHATSLGRPKTMQTKCLMALAHERRGLNQPNIGIGERQLFALLTALGVTPRPQVAIGPYNCDLALDSVAIEVFGGGWHWFGHHGARLHERTHDILNRGWHVYIIVLSKAFPLSEAVAHDLIAFAQRASRDPSARREYRVIRGDAQFLSGGYAEDDHLTIVPSLYRAKHIGQPVRHYAHRAG